MQTISSFIFCSQQHAVFIGQWLSTKVISSMACDFVVSQKRIITSSQDEEELPGNTFGKSVTSMGDIDGNGVLDLAVGEPGYETAGAIHVLLMSSSDPTATTTSAVVKHAEIITALDVGGNPGEVGFGTSVAAFHLDNDGVIWIWLWVTAQERFTYCG